MNILELLVNYLNGAYSPEYAPERKKKMEIKKLWTDEELKFWDNLSIGYCKTCGNPSSLLYFKCYDCRKKETNDIRGIAKAEGNE
jgi:hypothetical protein